VIAPEGKSHDEVIRGVGKITKRSYNSFAYTTTRLALNWND
jgi:hypothetical protein